MICLWLNTIFKVLFVKTDECKRLSFVVVGCFRFLFLLFVHAAQ